MFSTMRSNCSQRQPFASTPCRFSETLPAAPDAHADVDRSLFPHRHTWTDRLLRAAHWSLEPPAQPRQWAMSCPCSWRHRVRRRTPSRLQGQAELPPWLPPWLRLQAPALPSLRCARPHARLAAGTALRSCCTALPCMPRAPGSVPAPTLSGVPPAVPVCSRALAPHVPPAAAMSPACRRWFRHRVRRFSRSRRTAPL